VGYSRLEEEDLHMEVQSLIMEEKTKGYLIDRVMGMVLEEIMEMVLEEMEMV
jgi:hypothetical protein